MVKLLLECILALNDPDAARRHTALAHGDWKTARIFQAVLPPGQGLHVLVWAGG